VEEALKTPLRPPLLGELVLEHAHWQTSFDQAEKDKNIVYLRAGSDGILVAHGCT
jgi:hypothetical protein